MGVFEHRVTLDFDVFYQNLDGLIWFIVKFHVFQLPESNYHVAQVSPDSIPSVPPGPAQCRCESSSRHVTWPISPFFSPRADLDAARKFFVFKDFDTWKWGDLPSGKLT